jgi:hypothetical protein
MRLFKVFCFNLFSLFLFTFTLFAQAPDTLWTRTYGGIYNDNGCSVQQTTDGGYIIAGLTRSFGAGNADIYLIKTDSLGDTIWTKTYGGMDDDRGYSIQVTSDGGTIIAGWTFSYGINGDVYLVKTDADGDTLWTKTYGENRTDKGYSVQQTFDGGYIIAGNTLSFGPNTPEFCNVYLIRTNGVGDSLWTRTYGGADVEYGYSVQQTSDSGFVIVGATKSFGQGWFDIYFIRTDANGDSLWTKTYGGTDADLGNSVFQTSDEGYIIAGYTDSFGAGYTDVYLLKTNSEGDTLWTRTYGDTIYEWGNEVLQTSDNGYIITGNKSQGPYESDVLLIRTDSNGNSLWTNIYGGIIDDEGLSVKQTFDGGYIIAGYTQSFGAGLSDVYLIKIEPDPAGIEEHQIANSRLPTPFFEVSPNPFTSMFNVKCSEIGEKQKVKLQIYNISGRLIKSVSLTTKHLSLGTDLKAGIYFLKLNGKPVGKVVKVR